MLTLIVQEKGGSPTRMEFERDEVTVGRVPGNDIVLAKGNVSKRHSRVVRQDGRFFVVDLKSTNGTYLNGRRITTPSVIRPGDKIYIGDFVVMVDMGAENVVEEAPDALDDAQTGAGMVSPFANQPAFAPAAADPPSEEALQIAEIDDGPEPVAPSPNIASFGGPPPLSAPTNTPPAPSMPGRPPALTAQGPGSPLAPRGTAPLGAPGRPAGQGPSSQPGPSIPSFAGAPSGPGGPTAPMRSTSSGLGPARAPLGAPLGAPPGLRPSGPSLGGTREGNAPPPLGPSLRPSGPSPLEAPAPRGAPESPPAPAPSPSQATMAPGSLQAQAVAMPVVTPTAVPYTPPSGANFEASGAVDSQREVIPVMPDPVGSLMDPMRAATPVPVAPPAPRAFEPPAAFSAPFSASLAPPPSLAVPLAPLSTSLPPSVASPVVTAAFSAAVAPVVSSVMTPVTAPPRFSPRVAPTPTPEPVTGGDEYRELLAQVVSAARSQGVEPGDHVADEGARARMRPTIEGAARAMSALPAGVTHERLTRDALAELAGLGALESVLEDPEVTSVVVEPGGRVLVGRSGPVSPSGHWFSSAEGLGTVVSRWLKTEGFALDGSPVIDVSARDGTRMLAVFPPMSSTGLTVSLDRPAQRVLSLSDLVARGVLSQPAAALLSLAVTSRRNVVVCGPAGSGRSTLMGALLGAVAPQERVVVIETRSELARARRGTVGISSATDGARAVSLAQRMRPHRLVLSDVCESVARGALVALATGHEGWLLSVDAPSAMVGLSRLATMGALGPWFSPEDGTERIAITRPLVVEVARLGDGQCRVTSVGEARALDGALFIDLLFNLRVDRSDGAEGISAQLVPTGASASFGS